MNTNLIETVERIVIDYANFSGREIENRAIFREKVIRHLRDFVHQEAKIPSDDEIIAIAKKCYPETSQDWDERLRALSFVGEIIGKMLKV